MKSLWNESEARKYDTDLALRVYTSRLLGRNKDLVMHGGGNTSVKLETKNIFGETESLLYVKGSGWDLETIEEAGFAPVRMDHLLRLAELPTLSDPEMVNELKTHMTNAAVPTPSVETILHAILPFKYVDHTHADAIVTITNTEDGEARIREIYGERVVVIPYIMPGFDLARLCNEIFSREAHAGTEGMVLLNHGIFTFGETARESYERMIQLVDEAESYLQDKQAWKLPVMHAEPQSIELSEIAALRQAVSEVAGRPMILNCDDANDKLAFAQHEDIARISQQGPATPDHVIRTKRLPMLGRDVSGFQREYQAYFDRNAPLAKDEKQILDQAPRVILDNKLGLVSVGKSMKDASIINDIYSHTINIIRRGERLGGYRALPEKDIFDVEYWDLEQAKLKKAGADPIFSGEVALVTGCVSGIGRACVNALLKRGAAVIGLDIDINVETMLDSVAFLGLQCDLTNTEQVMQVLERGVKHFGGVDILILNAGIFPESERVAELSDSTWRKVMSINLDANLVLLRTLYPILKMAPAGGRVAVIGSKNVPAPGPGAAAYSVSKAALNQLARVLALEWGEDNIRINSLHPNGVFDTALWTEEILQQRARHYGISVDEYKRNNLLHTEVRSCDVAELACELCGPLFSRTTGAQIAVDGGNDRVV
ncbi:MAG: bifunctional aldolase/short-chain dehydrogenase [Gammaproteobacteria bacterium]|nr:MAG: bifunctional aldolase/short-chain dehydrogenase [Gammaproteobacteria bacterium]